jgi:hypothetical protein
VAFVAPEVFSRAHGHVDGGTQDGEKRDVYAFSIVLWQLKEIKMPYKGEDAVVIQANVRGGYRLTFSDDDCPGGLKNLIVRCWDATPSVRLSFEESTLALEGILSSMASGSSEPAASITDRQQLATKSEQTRNEELLNSSVQMNEHPKQEVGAPRQSNEKVEAAEIETASQNGWKSADGKAVAAATESNNEETETSIKLAFHEVFIGDGKPNIRRDGSFLTLELDKLTPAKLVQFYKDCGGRGLAKALQPYLTDILQRQDPEGFQTILDTFVSAVNEEEKQTNADQNTLPHLLLELTTKDVFVSLLEITPESVRGRLAYYYASLHYVVPFVYVLQTTLQQTKTVTNFSALQEVLAVPSYPLVVSCGTETVVGRGKSSLTERLARLLKPSSLNCQSFDIQTLKGSGGPTHLPSIDLALEVTATVDGGLNFADVHGWTLERKFCRALSTLCSVAALILVHVTREDFDVSSAPGEGLKSLLFTCCSLHVCDAQVAFLVRDVPSNDSGATDCFISSAKLSLNRLLPNRVAEVIAIENLHTCRTDSRRQKVVVRIGDRVRPILQELKSSLPCFEVINKQYVSVDASEIQPFKRQLEYPKDGFSDLGRQVCEILDRSLPVDGKLAARIFPLSTVCAEIARNRHRENEILARNHQCENVHETEAQSSDQVRSELAKLAEELRQLKNQRLNCEISEAVKFFAALVKHEKYHICEIQHYLEIWKVPHVNPLKEERRKLINQLQSTECLFDEAISSRVDDIRRRVEALSVQIDQLDITVESFWSELMELCALQEDDTVDWDTLQRSCQLDPALAKQVYTRLTVEGYPMQLLRGRPLQMNANGFLKDVLLGLDSKSTDKPVVVSVIGAQGSAKSSLLNHLFGCRFTARAGGCTEGLYASYVSFSDGRRLLVLDSEGLLSHEVCHRFHDRKITAMTMACSDLVILNLKGEISSQLKELLKEIVPAMDYLKVSAKPPPEMMFVLRDQRDLSTTVLNDAVGKVVRILKEAVSNSRLTVDDLLPHRHDSVFLLPSASSKQKRDEPESLSGVFSERVFLLRSRIVHWAVEVQSKVTTSSHEGTPLIDRYYHACVLWDALTKLGHNLEQYETVYELCLRKEICDVMKATVKNLIEADTGLSGRAAEIVKNYSRRLQAAKDKQSVAHYDTECRSKLSELRKQYQKNVLVAFDAKTSADKYHEELKQRFRLQLTAPVTHVYDVHVDSWQLQIKATNDRLNTEAINRHFVLDNDMMSKNEYSCAMTETEATKVFEERWLRYGEYKSRMGAKKRNITEVKKEVEELFKSVVSIHEQDDEMLSIVSCGLPDPSELDDGVVHFIDDDDQQWFQRYLEMKPADILHKASVHTVPSVKTTVDVSIVQTIRETVRTFLTKVHITLLQSDKLDTAAVTDIVLAARDITADIEGRILIDLQASLKLRRTHFIKDFFIHLRQIAVQASCSADEKRSMDEILMLEKTKLTKRKTFVDMVCTNSGDLERAVAFADSYNEMLQTWVKSRVLEFTSDIRNQVLKQIPNLEDAAARAYNYSFGRGNYKEVLEYCLDINAYLKKLFTLTFKKHKATAIDQRERILRGDIGCVYRMLCESAEQFQKSSAKDQKSPDQEQPSPQPESASKVCLQDFKVFLQEQASDVNQPTDIRSRLMVVVSTFPEVTNFPIERVGEFCKAFGQQILGTCLPTAIKSLDDEIGSSMDRECREVWIKLIRCGAKCPLCGSKCSLGKGHVDHGCSHHILPAFHGFRKHGTNFPVLEMCRSSESACCEWTRGDDQPQPSLAEALEFYADYRLWKKSVVPPDPTLKEVPIEQIQAWVNCRKPLLAHWKLVDCTPVKWNVYESSSALDEDEIDDALKRLKEFQNLAMADSPISPVKVASVCTGPTSASQSLSKESVGMPPSSLVETSPLAAIVEPSSIIPTADSLSVPANWCNIPPVAVVGARCTKRAFGEMLSTYPLGSVLALDEIDVEIEYHSLYGLPLSTIHLRMMELTVKFITACLNSRCDGTIGFGINGHSDEVPGLVVGITNVKNLMALVRASLENLLEHHIETETFSKLDGLQRDFIKLHPIRVTPDESCSRDDGDVFVFEIDVKPQWDILADHFFYYWWFTSLYRDLLGADAYRVYKNKDFIGNDRNNNKVLVERRDGRTRELPLTHGILLSQDLQKRYQQHLKKMKNQSDQASVFDEVDTVRLLKEKLKALSTSVFNFMLFTNSIPPDMRTIRPPFPFNFLKLLPWVTVVDFDPNSESDGLYRCLTTHVEEGGCALSPLPFHHDDCNEHFMSSSRMLDKAHAFSAAHQLPWIFANGREGNRERVEDYWMWFFQCHSNIDFALRQTNDKFPHLVAMFLVFGDSSIQEMASLIDSVFSHFKLTQSIVASAKRLVILCDERGTAEILFDACKVPYVRNHCVAGLTWDVVGKIVTELTYTFPQTADCDKSLLTCSGSTTQVPLKRLREWKGIEVLDCFEGERKVEKDRISIIRDNFYKGEPVSWNNLKLDHDVKRDIAKKVRECVRDRLVARSGELDEKDPTKLTVSIGVVTILHQPGTGGSTLARRVLWDVHQEVKCRCAVLDGISDNTLQYLADLQTIGEKNPRDSLPLLLCWDGDDIDRNNFLNLVLQLSKNGVRGVIIEVKALSHKSFDESEYLSEKNKKTFLVPSELREEEVIGFKQIIFQLEKDPDTKSRLLENIDIGRRLIYFGLELFGNSYNQQKLKNYVLDRLQRVSHVEQQILRFCSFVYIYGHLAIPRRCFTDILLVDAAGGSDLEQFESLTPMCFDLLLEVTETAGRHSYFGWRPAHQLVAEVILKDQDRVRTAIDLMMTMLRGRSWAMQCLATVTCDLFCKRVYFHQGDEWYDEYDDIATDFCQDGVRFKRSDQSHHPKPPRSSRYSLFITDILESEQYGRDVVVALWFTLCTFVRDNAYAWQHFARFLALDFGGEHVESLLCHYISELLDENIRMEDYGNLQLFPEDDVRQPVLERNCKNSEEHPSLDGFTLALKCLQEAHHLEPNTSAIYTTEGLIHKTKLESFSTQLKNCRNASVEDIDEALTIAFSAINAFKTAQTCRQRYRNWHPLVGEIQVCLKVLRIIKDSPFFEKKYFTQDRASFESFVSSEEVELPRELSSLSLEQSDFLKGLVPRILRNLHSVFQHESALYADRSSEEPVQRRWQVAVVAASELQMEFYSILALKTDLIYNRRERWENNPRMRELLCDATLKDRLENPYGSWQNVPPRYLHRIIHLLMPVVKQKGHNVGCSMMVALIRACLEIDTENEKQPKSRDIAKVIHNCCVSFPHSEWAHMFQGMIHFPFPDGQNLLANPKIAIESFRTCDAIMDRKPFILKRARPRYFVGKTVNGQYRIISLCRVSSWLGKLEQHRTEGVYLKDPLWWRSFPAWMRLARLQGTRQGGTLVNYQGISIRIDQDRHYCPEGGRDRLWFCVGFTVQGPIAFDPIDETTYRNLCEKEERGDIPTFESVTEGRRIKAMASAASDKVDYSCRRPRVSTPNSSDTHSRDAGDNIRPTGHRPRGNFVNNATVQDEISPECNSPAEIVQEDAGNAVKTEYSEVYVQQAAGLPDTASDSAPVSLKETDRVSVESAVTTQTSQSKTPRALVAPQMSGAMCTATSDGVQTKKGTKRKQKNRSSRSLSVEGATGYSTECQKRKENIVQDESNSKNAPSPAGTPVKSKHVAGKSSTRPGYDLRLHGIGGLSDSTICGVAKTFGPYKLKRNQRDSAILSFQFLRNAETAKEALPLAFEGREITVQGASDSN